MFLRYLYVTGEQRYGGVNAPVRDLSGFFQRAVFWLVMTGLLGLCQGGWVGGRLCHKTINKRYQVTGLDASTLVPVFGCLSDAGL